MAVEKCERCGHEQDTEISRICDQCGRRMGKTRLDFPATEPSPEEEESVRCVECGVSTTRPICPNCGAIIRRGSA